MEKKLLVPILCCLVAAAFVTPADAFPKRYTVSTAGGTSSFNTSGNWSTAGNPSSTDTASITNVLDVDGLRVVTTVVGTANTIDFLRVGNEVGGVGTNKLLIREAFTSSFGAINSVRGIIEIQNSTARFGINSFITFNNSGQIIMGTNSLLFLASTPPGTASDRALTNAGTISFVNNATLGTDTGEINYGQTAGFTNSAGGTIIKSGRGTGTFVGVFGANNTPFINNGTIIVNAGVMKFDSRNAFTIGVSNSASSKIFIANASTVMVARTSAAWQGGNTIANAGSISLFGGEYLAFDTDTTTVKVSATNNNTGVISGSGTVQWRLINDSTGVLLATGGVLRITSSVVGAGGEFNAGNSSGGATLEFRGGNVGAGGTITGGITVTNSSAIIFSGDSDWTINSAAKYGFSGATAAERGSLINSNATGGGETLFLNNASFRNNQGTLAVVGGTGVGINYGQIGAAMTNNFVLTGNGSFTGEFGGNNNGVLNNSTISTIVGGTLTFDPRNATNFGGFQNAAGGTVVITNDSFLIIRRSDAAWFTSGVSPTNFGTITMTGGSSLVGSNSDLLVGGGDSNDAGRVVSAAGAVINVTGTNNISNFRFIQNNGLVTMAATAQLTNDVNSTDGLTIGQFDNRAGGVIQLNGTGSISGNGANVFVLNGNYISDSTSSITNTGGGAYLIFTGNRPMTNAGTISMIIRAGVGAGPFFALKVGTTPDNFVANTGTFIVGVEGAVAAKTFSISNQFVNAGTVILTNAANGGSGGQVFLDITGKTRATGGASTNESTGTIRMVQSDAAAAATAFAGTLSFANGDFVNAGTLTVNQVKDNASVLIVREAAGIFSNTATGRVIMESGSPGPGSLSIRADNIVNAGYIVLSNAGTINIQNAGATTTNLVNSGTILFAGGNLNATQIFNRVTGTIFGNGTFAGSATRLVDNSGTIRSSGGTLFLAMVTNSSRVILDPGSILRVQNLNNSGIVTSDSAGLVVRGNFVNTGSIVQMNSMGTFDGTVINSGLWITDPTTNIFGSTATITASGQIQASAGDVFIFKRSFVNQSDSNTTWNTLNLTPGDPASTPGTKFIFDEPEAGGTVTQNFFQAGLLLTDGFVGVPSSVTDTQTVSSFAAVAGFVTNFALGTLEIGNLGTNSILRLIDTFGTVSPDDGKTNSLFVNTLNIFGTSLLVISNDMRLYFVNSNGWSGANIFLSSGAEIHQLVLAQEVVSAVPEPSVLLLWLSGIVTVYAARRRAIKQANRSKT